MRLNGEVLSQLPLTPGMTDNLVFDTSMANLSAGESYEVTLSVENYIPDNANSTNFTATYRMVVTWDDTDPQSSNSS